MKNRQRTPARTHVGPLGSVTTNTDGTVNITIDPAKLHEHVVAQHERVLSDVRSARAAGMFPAGMLDELERVAKQELAKIKALPVPSQPSHFKITK